MVRYKTPLADFEFNFLIKNCFIPLISNLSSCQIGASSLKPGTLLDDIKLGSPNFFSPQIRIGITEWIKFSFDSLIIVIRLVFVSSPDYIKPSTILVSYSLNGYTWINDTIQNLSFLDSNQVELILPNPLQLKFLKIDILTLDQSIMDPKSHYIGLQMEAYSCTNSKIVPGQGTCLAHDQSLDWGDRHFLATSKGAVAACLFNPIKKKRVCFSSPDGETWKFFKHKLVYLLGVDINGNIYAATFDKIILALSSDIGFSWTSISSENYTQMSSASTFKAPLVVPYLSSSDNLFLSGQLTMGIWKANFDGLYKTDGSNSGQFPNAKWIP